MLTGEQAPCFRAPSILLVIISTIAMLTACGESRPAPALPDLAGASKIVREHLESRHDALRDGDAADWRRYARALHVHDYFAEAVAAYDHAAAMAPDAFEDLYLGGLAQKSLDPADAVTRLKKAEAIRRNYRPLLMELGGLYQENGDVDQSYDHFLRALKLAPDARVYVELADLSLAQDKLEQARDFAEEGRRLAPRSRRAWSVLAAICDALKDRKAAMAARKVAATLQDGLAFSDPILLQIYEEARSPLTLSHYGRSLAGGGETATAIATLKRAWALLPDEIGLPLSIGRLHRERSEFEPAMDHCRKALEIDPNDGDARLLEASLYVDTGSPARGLGIVEKLIAEEPERTDARLLIGLILRHARPNQAKAHLRFVIDKNPTKWEASLALAQILSDEGRQDRARDVIETFLELAPTHEMARRVLINLRRS